MTIINNKQEFQEFYHYWNDGKYKPKKYPKKYPCACKKEHVDGGLCGDYMSHYVVYFPEIEMGTKDAFILGLNTKWEYLC